tara:strand:+ start:15 stop:401 length:387 start_codon:yes stop_codon:yes gene_type:complete
MARSVSTPSGRTAVCYQDASHIEDSYDYDDYKRNIMDKAQDLFPSMDRCNKWIGREDLAILENKLAYIGISEYCGLVAIWLLPKDDMEYAGLAERWCEKAVPKFDSAFSEYRRIGTASNGESFFEKVA